MTNGHEDVAQQELVARLERIAKEFVNAARARGTDLRVIGGLGVRAHCGKRAADWLEQRPCKSDIDFIAPTEGIAIVEELFLGSKFNRRLQPHRYTGGEHREYDYESGATAVHVDIYFGMLTFNHDIPTPYYEHPCDSLLPITQLLLSKLAIVELSTKDIIDILAILSDHEIGEGSACETIQARGLMQVWADGCDGWEIAYTCNRNIATVRKYLFQAVPDESTIRRLLSAKLDGLQSLLERSPKPVCWKTRNVIGTRRQWFKTVEPDKSVERQ